MLLGSPAFQEILMCSILRSILDDSQVIPRSEQGVRYPMFWDSPIRGGIRSSRSSWSYPKHFHKKNAPCLHRIGWWENWNRKPPKILMPTKPMGFRFSDFPLKNQSIDATHGQLPSWCTGIPTSRASSASSLGRALLGSSSSGWWHLDEKMPMVLDAFGPCLNGKSQGNFVGFYMRFCFCSLRIVSSLICFAGSPFLLARWQRDPGVAPNRTECRWWCHDSAGLEAVSCWCHKDGSGEMVAAESRELGMPICQRSRHLTERHWCFTLIWSNLI